MNLTVNINSLTLLLGSPELPSVPEAVQAPDLTNVASRTRENGITHDIETGLMWSDTLGGARISFAAAETACRDLRLGGFDDWRLPTLQELQDLVDYDQHNPAIDTTLFPDTRAEAYWTASSVAGSSGYAWLVAFDYGGVGGFHRYDGAFARAVRRVPASQ